MGEALASLPPAMRSESGKIILESFMVGCGDDGKRREVSSVQQFKSALKYLEFRTDGCKGIPNLPWSASVASGGAPGQSI